MSAFSVLIPGAAGATAIDAIKRVRINYPEANVVATDRDPNAAGFHLADTYAVTQSLEVEGMLDAVCGLMRRTSVRIILPTCRSDTAVYSGIQAALSAVGAVFVGSDSETVALCDDKAVFRSRIAEHFPMAPQVAIGAEGPETYPCFVKPRCGSGGKGVALCQNAQDWHAHRAAHHQPMVAEAWVRGTEYSVDVFSDFDGQPLVAVPRMRLKTLDGVATHIAVIDDQEIEALAIRLAAFLGLKGASCLQFRRDSEGRVYVQEANPRLGGASIASALAGVDLVHLSVRLGLGLPLTIARPRQMQIFRYFAEVSIPTEASNA
jgi:carbamoyl-phosphate synthase large subunit